MCMRPANHPYPMQGFWGMVTFRAIVVTITLLVLLSLSSCSFLGMQPINLPTIEQTQIERTASLVYIGIIAKHELDKENDDTANFKAAAKVCFSRLQSKIDSVTDGETITVAGMFNAVRIANGKLPENAQIKTTIIDICEEIFIIELGKVYVPVDDEYQNLYAALRQIVSLVNKKLNR